MGKKNSKNLSLEIWDNGHWVNCQLIDYSTGRAVLTVSKRSEKEIFEALGNYFLRKSGKVSTEPVGVREKNWVF